MPPGYCSEGGVLRKMETAKLLKTAPYIHTMIENLLDIDVRKHALNKGQYYSICMYLQHQDFLIVIKINTKSAYNTYL